MGNYDSFAERYAERTAELEEQTRVHFRSLLPSLHSRKLLDVGCGSGHDATYYAAQGAKVQGIDISQKEVLMAQERNCGIFRVGSMNALPYKADTFDVVTSAYALQASEEVPVALQEMIRVAKRGTPILILTKHPFRNLLEGHVNDGNSDYYAKRNVTSHIFRRTITLSEPGHTMRDYLDSNVLQQATLEHFEEHSDFPASEQVIDGLNYPTYMILRYRKK